MTKKLVAAATALCLAGSMTATAVPALAKSENAAEVIIIEDICVYQAAGFNAQGKVHYVDTKTGLQILVCQMDLISGPEVKTPYVDEGYTCSTPFSTTNDSRTIITPAGKVTSVCKFHSE